MSQTENPSRLKKFWSERVVNLIVAQFTQGFTPQKISLTMALGISLGIFPIFGATSTLCAVFGIALKLNQPVIQLVNWLISPLQMLLILVFVRIGEWLARAQPVSFSIPELFRKFHESPSKFMHEFGLTGLHGIIAWLVIAPFLSALIYFLLLPSLKKLAQIKRQNAD
jgi:uncharacterized protein (DUF2062 family)